MRYHYDFEFEDNGKCIIPISLGIVSDDDRRLYLINQEYAQTYHDLEGYEWRGESSVITPWLCQNVMNKIEPEDVLLDGYPYDNWGNLVLDFISDSGRYTSRDEIELVGWYAAYDHVALSQIWGSMMSLPEPIPMFTRELEDFRKGQLTPARNKEELPEHHALFDAIYQKQIYDAWTLA